jgi:hypothetical protein
MHASLSLLFSCSSFTPPRFSCFPPPSPDNPLHLSCHPNDGFIHVLDSSFGQGQGTFDFHTGVIAKGNCHTPMDITNSGCQGAAACDINVNSASAHGIDPVSERMARTGGRMME